MNPVAITFKTALFYRWRGKIRYPTRSIISSAFRGRRLHAVLSRQASWRLVWQLLRAELSSSLHLFKQKNSSSSPGSPPVNSWTILQFLSMSVQFLNSKNSCCFNSWTPSFKARWKEPSLQEYRATWIVIYVLN